MVQTCVSSRRLWYLLYLCTSSPAHSNDHELHSTRHEGRVLLFDHVKSNTCKSQTFQTWDKPETLKLNAAAHHYSYTVKMKVDNHLMHWKVLLKSILSCIFQQKQSGHMINECMTVIAHNSMELTTYSRGLYPFVLTGVATCRILGIAL